MFEPLFWQERAACSAWFLDRSWNSLSELSTAMHDGKENMVARRSTCAKLRRLRRWFGKNKYDLSFLYTGLSEYSSIDKMAKYDCNTFRNYVVFLPGRMAPGIRRPHHDSELISCYHDAVLTWGHYHNNIVLFYHDSPITRSHFMDPIDRAIRGFYCISKFEHGNPWSRSCVWSKVKVTFDLQNSKVKVMVKVKAIGHIWGLEFNRYVCFSFCGIGPLLAEI